MKNYFFKHLLFLPLFVLFLDSLIAQELKRYIWLSVPYTFTEREKYINSEEICEYISSQEKDKKNTQKSIIQKCTTTPARYIPEKTSTKNLRVHVDCKDRTYDAKGDGKGWRKLVLEETVLNSAKEPCLKNGYVIGLNDYVFNNLNRNKSTPYSTIPQTLTYEKCLKDSINQLSAEKDLSLSNPKSIGLSTLEQVNAYYLQLRSNLPNICKQITSLETREFSKVEIQLSIWDPMKLEAIEYVMKNINNCKNN